MYFEAGFADLNIGIEANYPQTKEFCADYLTQKLSVDFSVSLTIEDIKKAYEEEKGRFSMQYMERLEVQRCIASQLWKYQRFLMHGAVLTFQNRAYMFTALSGTGKSTHVGLWKEYLGEAVQILNGDKPFLEVKEQEIRVYGTPWCGKEGWNTNASAALAGLILLQRKEDNPCSQSSRIRSVAPAEILPQLFLQLHLPPDPVAAGVTLELFDQLLTRVPVYVLECDISEAAVRTSFEALTGKNYNDYRRKQDEN